MPISFTLQFDSTDGIGQQLVKQVELAIARQALSQGEPMPSVRALAGELAVNPNTIANAYKELVNRGALISQRGRGYFVAAQHTDLTLQARQKKLVDAAETFVAQTRSLGFSREELTDAINSLMNKDTQ